MNMYGYIKEQPAILKQILERRKDITENFVKVFEKNDIKGITIIGSGSSYNASTSAKYFMEKVLKIKVNVIYPYLFNNYENILNKDELFIAVSQGGRSSATIDSVKKCKRLDLHNIVLTAEPKSPLRDLTNAVIDIACGEELVGYKTKGYTSTILTLYLMTLEVAYTLKKISSQEYEQYIKEIEDLISSMNDIIEKADKWFELNKEDLIKAEKAMVVGYGPNYGTALEGRLKLNETVRISVICHELEEFMHGPQLSLDDNYYLFFIASPGAGYERINNLYDYVSKITKHSYMVQYCENTKEDKKVLCSKLSKSEEINPIQCIIPFQVLAYRMANSKKIDLATKKFPDFYSTLNVKL